MHVLALFLCLLHLGESDLLNGFEACLREGAECVQFLWSGEECLLLVAVSDGPEAEEESLEEELELLNILLLIGNQDLKRECIVDFVEKSEVLWLPFSNDKMR